MIGLLAAATFVLAGMGLTITSLETMRSNRQRMR